MSLKKIFTAIFGVIVLINLKNVIGLIEPFYEWLCDSLYEIRYWDQDMQAVIAVTIIIAIVFLTLRIFNK